MRAPDDRDMRRRWGRLTASLGLTRGTGVAFALLMASALALLVYAGWRIGLDLRGSAEDASPTPSVATVAGTPPPCPQAPGPSGEPADAQASPPPRPVFAADRFAVGSPEAQALAYLGADRTLLVGSASEEGMGLQAFTLFGDRSGSRLLDVEAGAVLAADRASPYRLLSIVGAGSALELVEIVADARGVASEGVALGAGGVGRVSAMDVDESASSLVFVDPITDRIVRMRVDPAGQPPQVAAPCSIALPVLRDAADVLVAARPADGAIFLASAGGTLVHELGPDGTVVATYDAASADVGAIRGLAFAPSADPRDPNGTEHLYVLDERALHTDVVALAFEPPVQPPAEPPTVAASAVQSIDLAALDPPSSDPGGLTYDSVSQRVIVTDSDIDELAEFAGSNVFARGADGSWQGIGAPAELVEVSDVAVDERGNRWIFSDDSLKLVAVFDLGPDAAFGTRDDRLTRISTPAFGNGDPEGVAFGQQSLFITDGEGARIYRLSPGEDGRFDGVGDRSDDTASSFDTSVHGVTDPEGIAFDPATGTLYVISRREQEPIIELGTDGRLIRRITLPQGLLVSPGGLAMLPATEAGNLRLLIADRGADNARSSVPSDGRLIEIEVPPTGTAE